jgi:hypothetical protein
MNQQAGNDRHTQPPQPSQNQEQWNAQGWSDEPVPAIGAPKLGVTISIRLDPESARIVRRAARLRAKTLSEFVRGATLREATSVVREAETTAIQITSARVVSSSAGGKAAASDSAATSTSSRNVVLKA